MSITTLRTEIALFVREENEEEISVFFVNNVVKVAISLSAV